MSVFGHYKDHFSEATHCCFNGHLDDPSFRSIAIQRITRREGKTVCLSASGDLQIKKKAGKEYVILTYDGFFGGKVKTTGHPFKDDKTDLV